MSLIPTALTVLAATLEDLISPVIFQSRFIGPFVADVTVEETSVDELALTEHPVEIGAAITDHAYLRPAQVTIKAGWSNSSYSALGNPVYVRSVYEALRSLQQSRIPFSILTGKRLYQNMLVTKMLVTTDEKTENVLSVTLDCREVILVSTQTVSVSAAGSQTSPENTAPTTDRGALQLVPATKFTGTVGGSASAL